ncbi:Double-stranded RNA-binding protein 7 [Acorus calamus]|uniref:Double-stranded RNA-binding protein 7 n=1 Tax=Acorus calamus TaxID=4465 RepID=A0AAV9DMP0_ACOCL|nr:Double-stranded RNA-binding protein 7 [Acorus calamus]
MAETKAPANPVVAEHFLYKNRLQEYAQRSAVHTPLYTTINGGNPHAPRFRSTVVVDGLTFTSPNTFSHRKEAEQDVARLALEGLSEKVKDEGCPLIYADSVFCKSILNEFATKMKLSSATYTTTQSEGPIPVFISSVIFDGKEYTGRTGKNKKEAQQLGARAVIESILESSPSRTLLSQIIKSKSKLYNAILGNTAPAHTQDSGMPSGGDLQKNSGQTMVKGKEIVTDSGTDKSLASPVILSSNIPVHASTAYPPPLCYVNPQITQGLGSCSNASGSGTLPYLPLYNQQSVKPISDEPNLKADKQVENGTQLGITSVPAVSDSQIAVSGHNGKRRAHKNKKGSKAKKFHGAHQS